MWVPAELYCLKIRFQLDKLAADLLENLGDILLDEVPSQLLENVRDFVLYQVAPQDDSSSDVLPRGGQC